MTRQRLQTLLNTPGELLRVAGAHNALGARLIEGAGFDGVWASSLQISTSQGCLDSDGVTMTHVLAVAASIARAVRLPVIADCGAGGREPADVARMVRAFEDAGVAAACIEDAQYPMRNSLLPGRQKLASLAEFAEKVAVAKAAQRSAGFRVVARVEALIAGAGHAEALRRARAYVDAGADAILIHSKAATPDEVLDFVADWDRPTPLALVPTTYHALSEQQMRDTEKVRMVIYANQTLRAAIRAVKDVLRQILHDGDAHRAHEQIASLDEVFEFQAMCLDDAELETAPEALELPR